MGQAKNRRKAFESGRPWIRDIVHPLSPMPIVLYDERLDGRKIANELRDMLFKTIPWLVSSVTDFAALKDSGESESGPEFSFFMLSHLMADNGESDIYEVLIAPKKQAVIEQILIGGDLVGIYERVALVIFEDLVITDNICEQWETVLEEGIYSE